MMFRFFVFFILLTQAAFAGEISGTVYFSENGKNLPLASIPLRLHIYKDDYEFSGIETKTDKFGRYIFHNLQTESQYSYILYPIYEGMNYPYVDVNFSKDQNVKKDFMITKSTGSMKDLSIQENIFFEFGKKDIWKITHDVTVENKGETLYHSIRSDAEPMNFSLFKGGFDLSYLEGITRENSKIDEENDQLQVFLTLPAHKTSTFSFSYYFIPESRKIKFERDAGMARSNMSLFFQNRAKVVSNQFKNDPTLANSEKNIQKAFTSGPIAKDQKIIFEIRGFYLKQDFLHMALLALCATFSILMSFLAIMQAKKKTNRNKELEKNMRLHLLQLKRIFEAGSLDESLYTKEVHQIKNYLFQISKLDKE